MEKGFTKCKNGHYYMSSLANCPMCEKNGNATQIVGGSDETQIIGDSSSSHNNSDGKTQVFGGFGQTNSDRPFVPQNDNNRTVFGDEVEKELASGKIVKETVLRNSRKLVGWLVSYTHDEMGIDYKLYEGRNIVGRGLECSITIVDNMMTEKHATILFRDGNYIIKDELSSHGTFVNDQDIIDENYRLKDGDVIKMGKTIFKFKSSL